MVVRAQSISMSWFRTCFSFDVLLFSSLFYLVRIFQLWSRFLVFSEESPKAPSNIRKSSRKFFWTVIPASHLRTSHVTNLSSSTRDGVANDNFNQPRGSYARIEVLLLKNVHSGKSMFKPNIRNLNQHGFCRPSISVPRLFARWPWRRYKKWNLWSRKAERNGKWRWEGEYCAKVGSACKAP